MSTVWAVPASRFLQASRILKFLRETRCSNRGLEVRIFNATRKAQIASVQKVRASNCLICYRFDAAYRPL